MIAEQAEAHFQYPGLFIILLQRKSTLPLTEHLFNIQSQFRS